MEQYFAIVFEDIRHQRSPILLLSLTNPDKLRQSKINEYEIDIKILALENLNWQRILKEHIAI